jgi:hypothetical protein
VDKAVISPTLSTLGITSRAYPLINRPNEWKQKEFFRKKFNQKIKVGKTRLKGFGPTSRFWVEGLAPSKKNRPGFL